jgi:hypothetical protein
MESVHGKMDSGDRNPPSARDETTVLKDKTGVGEAYSVKHDLRASRIS